MADAWSRLRQAATLGTARAALPDPTDLETQGLPERPDPESRLLDRAAVLGIMRLAGRRSLLAPAPPTAAPPETTPVAGRRADALLGRLLDQPPLLLEWLHHCRAAGRHVPPTWLPELLDQTGHSPEVRAALRPVLGQRGAWLARQNPAWRFALPPALPSEEAWQAATPAVREELFRAAREADPAAARELLRARWPTERADVRERLLDVMSGTATAADSELADLLEAALDDRSREVRRRAQRVLARLPQSAYQLRMGARLRALVQLPPQASGLARLNPLRERKARLNGYTPDDQGERDGLPGAGASVQAVFGRLLECLHPETLLSVLGPEPALAVQRVQELGAMKALEALMQGQGPEIHQGLAQALAPFSEDYARHLPPSELETRLLTLLRRQPNWRDATLRGLLWGLPRPWTPRMSGEVFRALVQTLPAVEKKPGFDPAWHGWTYQFDQIALFADPFAPLPALPEDAPEAARAPWQALAATLHTRREIHDAFQKPTVQEPT